jgi:quercetin dioxygenase-like cupin family protein
MRYRSILGAILFASFGAAACEVDPPPPPETLPDIPPVGIVDEGPEHHLIYAPGDVAWVDAPPSLEEGAQVAVLEGDPGAPGIFTMRIRMPDGFLIAPHWHPNVERVTVLSGAFLLGSDETVEPEAAVRLEPGSYTAIPPETVHYALADGETVIQLTSVGPWELNYADPGDDPRMN